MKKLITLFAAAIMAVGANAQEKIWILSGNPGWGQCTADRTGAATENFDLHFRNQYSGFPIAANVNTNDYKGVAIEYDCSVNTAGVQIIEDIKEGTAKYNAAIDPTKNEYSINFHDEAVTNGKIASLSIWQGGKDGKCDITIKKVSLIKSDGSKEQVTTFPDVWEGTAYLSGSFVYRAKWNGAALKDDNSKDLTFNPSLNETHTYVVTLEEPATINLKLLPAWEGGADYGCNIQAGQTTGTFVFTPDYANVVSKMTIWTGDETGFPANVKIKSITRTITTPTGVQKVEVLNAANAEFVNAAGQKVGKNYKGLVINKATGKKFINK